MNTKRISWTGNIEGIGLFIGDICYALSDEVYHAAWGPKYIDGPIEYDGRTIAVTGYTAYGDGEYYDQKGNIYGVDAGNIGVCTLDYADDSFENLMKLGKVIEIPEGDSARVEYRNTDGNIFITIIDEDQDQVLADVHINTDESEDEDSDEYAYNNYRGYDDYEEYESVKVSNKKSLYEKIMKGVRKTINDNFEMEYNDMFSLVVTLKRYHKQSKKIFQLEAYNIEEAIEEAADIISDNLENIAQPTVYIVNSEDAQDAIHDFPVNYAVAYFKAKMVGRGPFAEFDFYGVDNINKWTIY